MKSDLPSFQTKGMKSDLPSFQTKGMKSDLPSFQTKGMKSDLPSFQTKGMKSDLPSFQTKGMKSDLPSFQTKGMKSDLPSFQSMETFLGKCHHEGDVKWFLLESEYSLACLNCLSANVLKATIWTLLRDGGRDVGGKGGAYYGLFRIQRYHIELNRTVHF